MVAKVDPKEKEIATADLEARDEQGAPEPRRTYTHVNCGQSTTMEPADAQAFADDPDARNGLYCCLCRSSVPFDEVVWNDDNQPVKP